MLRLISLYARFSFRREGLENLPWLRSEIARIGQTTDLSALGIGVRAGHWMARRCPLLLTLAYPVYHGARLLALRLREK